VDIRSLTSEREYVETTLRNKREEVAEAKKLKLVVANTILINARNHEKQNDDFNHALTILDKALALLEKARDSCNSKYHKIKHSLRKTRTSTRLFMTACMNHSPTLKELG